MEREELAAWLRLALTPQIGNGTARRLLAAFGLPQGIFEQPEPALAEVLTPAQVRALRTVPGDLEAQVELTWAWLSEDPERRRLCTLGDPGYPASLLHIEDPPLLLYLMGLPLASGTPAVAIVGSRNATPQGLQNARAFGQALAGAGVTVVSGLALGIDGAAHEGALDGAAAGQLATVAVVGTGLDRVYPRRHLALARRIAERGLLVSEYFLGTPPLDSNFPKRNRLISGLSQGTLVVEAALQSGSLITARMASEQGKDVFAIPGSIHSPQSRGCHALLRQGAKLVESAQDVLEELRLAPPGAPRAAAAPDASAASDDPPLLEALGFDPVVIDALVARTGIPPAALQAALLELELAGAVARLPGGLFQRQGSA
ncbi:DNA-protecting protein DprA [Caenimonas sedimenti]|uniref:DNA-protecting protein DprA n=1 Tax=Caenimonas sedimenti TaxID=2596921 RepID=A0A562ZM64_9BURK|nr:DNA-processing protein DprA [Caenimonas sedimenti]TWO69662.1 DNA-protecting protein DprA [Caenimonas sedimenti]